MKVPNFFSWCCCQFCANNDKEMKLERWESEMHWRISLKIKLLQPTSTEYEIGTIWKFQYHTQTGRDKSYSPPVWNDRIIDQEGSHITKLQLNNLKSTTLWHHCNGELPSTVNLQTIVSFVFSLLEFHL